MKLNDKEIARFTFLSHSSNASKSDEQFKEWQDLRKRLGKSVPTEKHRFSTQRALHDKY